MRRHPPGISTSYNQASSRGLEPWVSETINDQAEVPTFTCPFGDLANG